MTHAYRGLRGPAVQDAVLPAAWLLLLVLPVPGALRATLLVAIPLVMAWGAVTLHFPTRVDVDDAGITFHHWGRAHAFAWKDVTRVRVRRFVVGDRVLVRIEPAGAWRGRYWIYDSIEGFEGLVARLESARGP